MTRQGGLLVVVALLAASTISTPALAQTRATAPSFTTGSQLASLANLFAGTDTSLADQGTGGSAGGASPAAAAPFGMVEWGPHTSPDISNFAAGYSYRDSTITGFSVNHFQGGGCAGLGDLPFMPTLTSVTSSPARLSSSDLDPTLSAAFDHAHETSAPGSYTVTLNPATAEPITVNLLATTRAGLATVSFPATARTGSIVLNAGGSATADSSAAISVDPHTGSGSATVAAGDFCTLLHSYTVHAAFRFDEPIASTATWQRTTFHEAGTRASDEAVLPLSYTPTPGLPASAPGNPSGTAQAGLVVRFDLSKTHTVHLRLGLSYVSEQGAQEALNTEVGQRPAATIADATRAAWARMLGKVSVAGGSSGDRRELATTLYQSMLSPQVMSDEDGRYPGLDGNVHLAPGGVGHAAYTLMSLWDEYRTHAQLLALLAPQQAADMAATLLADAHDVGYLPRWPIFGSSPSIMTGDPAIPFLADLAAYGVPLDRHALVAAALRDAASTGVNDAAAGLSPYAARPGEGAYNQFHYLPAELDTTTNTTGGIVQSINPATVWGSASVGLEYATADFAAARAAASTCDRAAATILLNRAGWWANNFNPRTRTVAPRSALGLFEDGSETGIAHGFTEGDGDQYTFMVPFDVAGLRARLGGAVAMRTRLDQYFTELNAGPSSPYAFLGNEPALGTPYEYHWLGRPDRTADIIRKAMSTLYAPRPDGYPGNTDGGTMTAWWIFGAIGLYPAIPGDDTLTVIAPLFPHVRMTLPTGRTIRIDAEGASTAQRYITSATVNSAPLTQDWLRYANLRAGATLTLRLATRPGTWANKATAPPSYPASTPLACN